MLQREPSSRTIILLILLLVTIQAACLYRQTCQGEEYIVTNHTIDDTYYYLQTAWNTWHYGFVTFDGIHPTNGVQFLWFLIILLIIPFAKTKIALLLATCCVCAFLNLAAYVPIIQIGRILKRPSLSWLMAVFWFTVTLSSTTYTCGMDNSLHAFIFWCVVWQVTAFIDRVRKYRPADYLILTIFLIFNAWTRLDSGITSLGILLFCVSYHLVHVVNFRYFIKTTWKRLTGIALFAGLCCVLLMGINYIMGGSAIPVSGLIKGTTLVLNGPVENLKGIIHHLFLSSPPILPHNLPQMPVIYLLELLGLLATLTILIKNSRKSPRYLALFGALWICLGASWFVQQAGCCLFGAKILIWYLAPAHIFWILTFSFLADQTFTLFARLPVRFRRATRLHATRRRELFVNLRWGGIILLSLVLIESAIYSYQYRVQAPLDRASLYHVRYHAALWIADRLPEESVLAAWNAGELGYFSGRTVINLDGLINSYDYYKQVLKGELLLKDYLLSNHVDYIVDYHDFGNDIFELAMPRDKFERHKLTHELDIVHTFPYMTDHGHIRIWQLTASRSETAESAE